MADWCDWTNRQIRRRIEKRPFAHLTVTAADQTKAARELRDANVKELSWNRNLRSFVDKWICKMRGNSKNFERSQNPPAISVQEAVRGLHGEANRRRSADNNWREERGFRNRRESERKRWVRGGVLIFCLLLTFILYSWNRNLSLSFMLIVHY